VAIHDEGLGGALYVSLVRPVGGVVLEHVSNVVFGHKGVVDGHHLQVRRPPFSAPFSLTPSYDDIWCSSRPCPRNSNSAALGTRESSEIHMCEKQQDRKAALDALVLEVSVISIATQSGSKEDLPRCPHAQVLP
jgi:hypothetical protein